MDFATRYTKLNNAQKQAVDTIDGSVMVIAGPGTGKTELLSMRVANILKQTDTLPESILCLTFTESGAAAMRERLAQIIGPTAYKVAIHTFHSFGTEIINQNGQFFYHGANFRPADELSSYEIIRGIFDELDYTNPLASTMNGEYTHLADTLRTISELKRSSLTSDELIKVLDQNDIALDTAEPQLGDIFAARIGKATAKQLQPVVTALRQCDDTPPLATITPLSDVMADSLQLAIDDAEASGKTTPITSWKNTWLKKNDKGEFVLKTRERAAKLRALSFIYYQYLSRMQEAELYDFDDMILRVVHAMEVFPELRYNLQERYQYILVDEFQDTNMAQMRILLNLTTLPTGDQPNIMVVGDDDQAIYSFQGADVSNIINFRKTYADTTLIPLTENYRSAPVILSHARQVITRGDNRLESHVAELDKTLTPHRANADAQVLLTEHDSAADERAWIVKDIAEKLEHGVPASHISVLARRHHEIEALLPYFADAKIPVNYERRDNVLELDIIRHLELLGKLLIELFEGHHDHAEAFIPELLAHPAWGYDAVEIWRLSLTARQTKLSWMEVMSTNKTFKPLHGWLIETAQMILHTPLERMIDHMLGVSHIEGQFVSPLKQYFFSAQRLDEQPDEYLTFLEALRTIRTKLIEYRPNDTPQLPMLLEFIDLHRELGSTIESVRPRVEQLSGAVNLMTAHKSKGLEFDVVYVIGAIDSAWGERVRSRSSLIGYPENLPLAPAGNTPDERLRLFFVAMTRAKKQLFITYSLNNNGKDTLPANFLIGEPWAAEHIATLHTMPQLTRAAELQWYQPLATLAQPTMAELLAPTLDTYRLSATDLCAFLDITHGGPQGFLFDKLLRFPQVVSPSAAYGSAIHKTLQRAHAHLAATKRHRAVEDILHDYETALKEQYLSDDDYTTYLQKGSDALQAFLAEKYVDFTPNQQAEMNFASQHALLGEAHLTGSIDLLERTDTTIAVTDYKTGKPVRDWKGTTDYEKIKLHRYKQQIMFYKLLIEHSRDFSRYTVDRGILQFVEPIRSSEIIALETSFDSDELASFKLLIEKVWRKIKALDLPDTSAYDQSFKGVMAFEADMLEDKV